MTTNENLRPRSRLAPDQMSSREWEPSRPPTMPPIPPARADDGDSKKGASSKTTSASPAKADPSRVVYGPGPDDWYRDGPPPAQRVVVADVDIHFTSLVWLMVKAAVAVIPAMLILAFVFFLLSLLFGFGKN